MPTYFAYGANMDVAAMRRRCPASEALGPGRLMNHRFLIMRDGTASVRRRPGSVVHGLLWRLSPADVRALDRFEEVDAGLYRKAVLPVLKPAGSVQALVYLGHTAEEGAPAPGYVEGVVACARVLGFPDPYLRSLLALCSGCGRADEPGPTRHPWRPDVRPRFATPLDRRRS